MGIGNLCDGCGTGVEGVNHDPCYSVDYGNRFVSIMLQDPAGIPFDDDSNGSVLDPADINSKIVSGDVSQIAVIPRINLVFPSTAATTLSAQESATGKPEPIEFEFQGDFQLQYIQKETWSQIEKLTFCRGDLRAWFVSNTGWVFGNGSQADADVHNGFEFMKIIHDTPNFNGPGSLGSQIPVHIYGIDKCWMKPIGQNRELLRLTETGIAV